MKKVQTIKLLLLLAVVVITGCSQTIVYPKIIESSPVDSKPFTQPFEGQHVPNFTYVDNAGVSHSLSDFKGTPVVIIFWATSCKSCKEDMILLEQLYKNKIRNYEIIAINLTDPDNLVAPYVTKAGYSFKVILDPDYKAQKSFKVPLAIGLPWVFFVDGNGIVKKSWIGPFYDKEPELRKVIDSL
jgi:peroxiredoxin